MVSVWPGLHKLITSCATPRRAHADKPISPALEIGSLLLSQPLKKRFTQIESHRKETKRIHTLSSRTSKLTKTRPRQASRHAVSLLKVSMCLFQSPLLTRWIPSLSTFALKTLKSLSGCFINLRCTAAKQSEKM